MYYTQKRKEQMFDNKGVNILDKSKEEKEFIEKLARLNEENLTYLLLVAQALFAEEKKGEFYSQD